MNRACRPTTIRVLIVAITGAVFAVGCATVSDEPAREPIARASDTPVEIDPPVAPQTAFERLEAPADRADTAGASFAADSSSLAEPVIYHDDAIARREPRPSSGRPRTDATPADATPADAVANASWPAPVVPPRTREPDPDPTTVPATPAASSALDSGAEPGASTPSAVGPSVSSAAPRASDAPAGQSVPASTADQRARVTGAPAPASAPASASAPARPTVAVRSTDAAAAFAEDRTVDEPVAPSAESPAVAAEGSSFEPAARPSSTPAVAGPTWNARTARVRADNEIEVVLPGRGWLYVGREYGDGEVTLLGKRSAAGDEAFRFRVEGPGSYGLWFQQQDAQTGRLVNERLGVEAVPGEGQAAVRVADLAVDDHDRPDASRTDRGRSDSGTLQSVEASDTPAATGSVASADGPVEGASTAPPADERIAALLSSDDASGALAVYADAVREEDGLLEELDEQQIAAIAAAIAPGTPLPVVRAFWRDVASSGSQLAPRARRELYEIALATEHPEDALRAVERLEQAGEASAEDTLRTASLLESNARNQEAVPLYARVLGGANEGSSAERAVLTLADDRLFEVAQFLERPGPHRDLRASARLYRIIVEDRPLSAHWDASRSRLEHLRRHYFEVR